MAFYLWITPRQRPFESNTDENRRIMLTFTVDARARAPVDNWEEELARLLSDAGLGTRNTDIFIGAKGTIPPDQDGPFINIIAKGSLGPDFTHGGDLYENLAAQIVTRHKSLRTARTRALAAWRALTVWNVSITA